ncbi:uncharacterized protein LOC128957049 [Oppia nitens]|uniref:uncharacterized protein LOC128957049 n=1 Tax=Oppia nitens TaxID=1686743 RepID=UPI0023DB9C0D|nr:uncharacterized protein LOC128957049 [Oppia nitens]
MPQVNDKQEIVGKNNLINNCDKKLRYYPCKYPVPKFTTAFLFSRCPIDITHEHLLRQWADKQFRGSQISAKIYGKLESVSLMPAFILPYCPRVDKYYTMVQMFMYFFILDDHNEEDWGQAIDLVSCRRVWGQVMALLRSIGTGRSAGYYDQFRSYVRSGYEIFYEIYRSYNSDQWLRFVQVWDDYCAGNVEERQLFDDRHGSPVTLNEILEIRKKAAGVRTCFVVLEYLHDYVLPETDWLDPRLQQLMDLTVLHILYVNDLFSFNKELVSVGKLLAKLSTDGTNGLDLVDINDIDESTILRHMYSNTVAVTAVNEGCSIQEAMQTIIDKVIECELDIIRIAKQWISPVSGHQQQQESRSCPVDPVPCCWQTKSFILSLIAQCSGNYKSNTVTDRYMVVGSTKTIGQHLTWD